LEPQMAEPASVVPKAPNAIAVRLLDTQARGHIGRRVLHKQPDGELAEDAVWRWSSAPDRYLDTALRLELTSRADVRLIDAADAPALAVTLVGWHLESEPTRLVGVIQIQLTAVDRTIREELIKESEPVSGRLPGNLATVAGRLLQRLASEGITRMTTAARPGA